MLSDASLRPSAAPERCTADVPRGARGRRPLVAREVSRKEPSSMECSRCPVARGHSRGNSRRASRSTRSATAGGGCRHQDRQLQLADIHRKDSGAHPSRVRSTPGSRSRPRQLDSPGPASGNGSLTAVMPQGAIRDSLAELTGIDLRGLGLLLSKDQHDTPLRCAVRAHGGDGTCPRKR